MKKRKVVISLANNRGNYLRALVRLRNSLREYWRGDVMFSTSEEQLNAPKHEINPYAFKVYAFEGALKLGYNQILWLDSSVYAVKDIQSAFDIIEKKGYLMQEAGHMVGSWCNERTLRYWELDRQQAMKMPMYGNAGMLGLDFTNPLATAFFKIWKKSMLDGQFIGSWEDHRHDMTNGSIIANLLGMKYERGDQLLQYAAPEDKPINDSIIFYAAGM